MKTILEKHHVPSSVFESSNLIMATLNGLFSKSDGQFTTTNSSLRYQEKPAQQAFPVNPSDPAPESEPDVPNGPVVASIVILYRYENSNAIEVLMRMHWRWNRIFGGGAPFMNMLTENESDSMPLLTLIRSGRKDVPSFQTQSRTTALSA